MNPENSPAVAPNDGTNNQPVQNQPVQRSMYGQPVTTFDHFELNVELTAEEQRILRKEEDIRKRQADIFEEKRIEGLLPDCKTDLPF